MNISDEIREKLLTAKGADEVATRLDNMSAEEKEVILRYLLTERGFLCVQTPPATWLANQEEDPHGKLYAQQRAQTALGHLPDDTLANAVFMWGDDYTRKYSRITIITAGKERIRWMSRALVQVLKLLLVARTRLAKYENVEVTCPVNGDLDRFLDTEYARYVRVVKGE